MPWRTDSVSDAIRSDSSSAPPSAVEGEEAGVMSWDDICAQADFQGRWLALDEARYDACGRATAGLVVDADDDLQELCMRVREADRRSCAIVFCEPNRQSSAPN